MPYALMNASTSELGIPTRHGNATAVVAQKPRAPVLKRPSFPLGPHGCGLISFSFCRFHFTSPASPGPARTSGTKTVL